MKKRNCAVCGSSEKKCIYQQCFVLPSTNYFHAGYDVTVCSRCGFAYADNVPDQAFVDEYYRQMTKKTFLLKKNISAGELEPQFLVRLHSQSVSNILPYLSKDERILDVGCYTGHLLNMLKYRGFNKLMGLDPSDYAIKIAKEKYGLDAVVGSLFDDLDMGQFDFVILTHVLEHIVDLPAFLIKVRDVLNSRGKVYIEVPDAHNFFLTSDPSDSIQAEHRDPFFQFSVEHVNYFTQISLHNLMSQMGFEKVFLESQVSTLAIVASLWRKQTFLYDSKIEGCLTNYIAECKEIYGNILTIIEKIVDSKKEIFIWGAGLHTQKLLGSSRLRQANIRAFVDSDPGYKKGILMGKPIMSPEYLRDFPSLPILISSQAYQDEIEKQIKDMGLANEVILLYERNVGK